jgi:polyhydroxyalkanoate synthesis regulator phasin
MAEWQRRGQTAPQDIGGPLNKRLLHNEAREKALLNIPRRPQVQIPHLRPVNAANHEQAFASRPMPTVQRAPVQRQVVPQQISTQFRDVPESLAKPLVDAGLASVEARALIEFCDHALEQARSTVTAVEQKFSARVESLNAQLSQKNQEIKALNQQIEDLQLLVQILERKKVG